MEKNNKELNDDELEGVTGGMTIDEYCREKGYSGMTAEKRAKLDIKNCRKLYASTVKNLTDEEVLSRIMEYDLPL